MTVRVVACTAAIQPDHARNSEIVAEGLFEPGACLLSIAQSGIALLDLRKQALFGGQQNALAIDVDRAALEHQPLPLAVGQCHHRLEAGHAVELGHMRRNQIVIAPVRIFRPAIEPPVGERNLACSRGSS